MRRKKRFNKMLALTVVLLFAALLLFSPLFTVQQVYIAGNRVIGEAEITEAAGLGESTNVFAFQAWNARKQLKKNPYIESVEIHKDILRREISIVVKERVLSGYVESITGSYLYIDRYGMVLEIATSFKERLPVVVGLRLTQNTVAVGRRLEVENAESFDAMVRLALLMNMYELETDVIRVDVSDVGNIHLYINNVDVEFGSLQDADEKVGVVKEIMKNLGDRKGFLDVRDMSKLSRFRYLS